MTIYIGADHNGFVLKGQLIHFLQDCGYDCVDTGDTALNPSDDFPQFAAKAVAALRADSDQNSRGILICGSGQGMCMTANRFKSIRASLCWSVEEARAARNDDDSNVLCLSARNAICSDTESIVMAWLRTPFAGASRFKRRIKEMDQLT